jgi:multidrug efflux pump subunit AcrA (membrane-fusion protein)
MPLSPKTFSRLLLSSAIAAAAFVPGCRKSDAEAKKGADGGNAASSIPVVLKPANVRPVQRYVEIVGTLWGDEDVTVSNKVNGKVIAVYKDVGDRVEPGEPIAQLLRNDYQLALNQKMSALRQVLAQLGTDKVPPQDFDVSGLPAVRRAKFQADNARAKFERGKQLHDQKPPLLSDQDFADLQAAFEVAQSGYQAELLTARALVTEAATRQAEVAIAEQALADTTIRAPRPMAGGAPGTASASADDESRPAPSAADSGLSFLVSERYVSVGELLPAVSKMFRVVDDDPLKFRAAVPERYVGDIKVGQKVGVTVEAYTDTFPGTVSRINPQIDPVNRMFQVEILVANEKHLLRPGGFARGRVQTRMQGDIVFVPQESVVTFAGVNKVFVVNGGKAAEVPVELGDRDGDEVEVLKGLRGSEAVVVSGTSKLAAGMPVSVKSDGAKSDDGERGGRSASGQ